MSTLKNFATVKVSKSIWALFGILIGLFLLTSFIDPYFFSIPSVGVTFALAAPLGFSLATEIADYLVRAHVPFAHAHEAAGKCVALCESSGRQLHQLTDAELVHIHPSLLPDVREVLTVHGALASRTTIGGTSPQSFAQQIESLKSTVLADEKKFGDKNKAFSAMMGA